jgi:hypothetical protein
MGKSKPDQRIAEGSKASDRDKAGMAGHEWLALEFETVEYRAGLDKKDDGNAHRC